MSVKEIIKAIKNGETVTATDLVNNEIDDRVLHSLIAKQRELGKTLFNDDSDSDEKEVVDQKWKHFKNL